jgi:hypothetical protein
LDVAITSPAEGSTVPFGELTIPGTSTVTPNTDCQVSEDWNDIHPYHVVTPKSPGDYSTWTFMHTSVYHLMTQGDTNDLAVKISCDGGVDRFDTSGSSDTGATTYNTKVIGQ